MEEYYKFDQFQIGQEDKLKPMADGVMDLVEKIRKVVNDGNYTLEEVINSLSNMFFIAAMTAVVEGRISMDSFIDAMSHQVTLATTEALKKKDCQDIDNIIKQAKKSANLK